MHYTQNKNAKFIKISFNENVNKIQMNDSWFQNAESQENESFT